MHRQGNARAAIEGTLSPPLGYRNLKVKGEGEAEINKKANHHLCSLEGKNKPSRRAPHTVGTPLSQGFLRYRIPGDLCVIFLLYPSANHQGSTENDSLLLGDKTRTDRQSKKLKAELIQTLQDSLSCKG